MQVSLRLFKKFLRLYTKDKLLFIQAYFYCGFFRAFIIFIPFNELREKMGIVNEESSHEISEVEYNEAKRISKIVVRASKYTIWESKCLVQALTAQKLLRKKRILSTLYLGVCKEHNNKLFAHAWLRCGDYIVTGNKGKDKFTIVAKFCA